MNTITNGGASSASDAVATRNKNNHNKDKGWDKDKELSGGVGVSEWVECFVDIPRRELIRDLPIGTPTTHLNTHALTHLAQPYPYPLQSRPTHYSNLRGSVNTALTLRNPVLFCPLASGLRLLNSIRLGTLGGDRSMLRLKGTPPPLTMQYKTHALNYANSPSYLC